jgi:hypothetical protein
LSPKSHITAFEALRILRSKLEFRDVELFCAGSTYETVRFSPEKSTEAPAVETQGVSSHFATWEPSKVRPERET